MTIKLFWFKVNLIDNYDVFHFLDFNMMNRATETVLGGATFLVNKIVLDKF